MQESVKTARINPISTFLELKTYCFSSRRRLPLLSLDSFSKFCIEVLNSKNYIRVITIFMPLFLLIFDIKCLVLPLVVLFQLE